MSPDLWLTTGCHCLAARRRARAVTRHFEARLRPHGLRATQFSILAMLALAGPRPMGAIAATLGLERTTLTRGAAPLERDGLVRTLASADARARPLRITPAGRRRLLAAYPAWKTAQDSVVALFGDPTRPAAPRARAAPSRTSPTRPTPTSKPAHRQPRKGSDR